MDANALIQAELTRIEDEAARQSSQLLAAQDSFVAAHVLVDLLKANGADDGLDVTTVYHNRPNGAAMVIYPGFHSDRTVTAIDRAGPFDTEEEAANAPQLLAERSRAWAEEDAQEDA